MGQQAGDKSANFTIGARRRLRFLFMIMLCFITWAGIKLWNQTDEVRAKMAQLNALQKQLVAVKSTNKSDQQQVARLQDPEYIEQMARKEFQMRKGNEMLIITPKSGE